MSSLPDQGEQEGEHNLLDRTMVFYTSNLGNSSSHDNTNLPIVNAGGGFKHQGHLAYPQEQRSPFQPFSCGCCTKWASRLTSFAPAPAY